MPTDIDYYRHRWAAAKVQFDQSYGMFNNDELVGFILHGIDRRHGHHIAFNAGTGVLPQFRGLRMVQALYDTALPQLKVRGITQCRLEVIQENAAALTAYQRVGFAICKHYRCYEGAPGSSAQKVELIRVPFSDIDWGALPHQELYSWDNHRNSIRPANFHYYYVLNDGVPCAYFAINAPGSYVAQFDVLDENATSWDNLFGAIGQLSQHIKINNVDEQLTDKIQQLHSRGFVNTVNQYEMELTLRP